MNKHTDISLRDLTVLFLDIQATAANPQTGEILELGWGESDQEPVSKTVAPVSSESIPNQITRLTGIDYETWKTGKQEETVWKAFLKDARKVRKANNGVCPVVIHYARYEKPFLNWLNELYEKKPFPFTLICTHEIARRLLPDLPRKSIRAVAGYFGHTINRPLSALNHVHATGFIWEHLIPLLKDAGIETLGDLTSWLSEKHKVKKTPRSYPMDKAILNDLPKGPGVYRMKRVNGDLLYIGKAKSLRQRVRSYFQKSTKHSEKNLEMLSQAQNLEYDTVNSALEAALLESDLIKKHSPPYNEQLMIKGRTLSFVSRDLMNMADKPGKKNPLGPVPNPGILRVLPMIVKGVNNVDSGLIRELHTAVFPDERYSPPDEIFAEGYVLFCAETPEISEGVTISDLLLYGDRLRAEWIEARAEMQEEEPAVLEEDTAEEEREEEEKKEPFDETQDRHEWTPGEVAGALRWIMSHSALLLRRARWFCMLDESVIGWESRDLDTCKHPTSNGGMGKKTETLERGTLKLYNFIVFRRGKMKTSGFVENLDKLPVPGKRKSRTAIQKHFDISAYDRMNVLMTELRRISSEERDIRIRLSRGVEYSGAKLERVLQWV